MKATRKDRCKKGYSPRHKKDTKTKQARSRSQNAEPQGCETGSRTTTNALRLEITEIVAVTFITAAVGESLSSIFEAWGCPAEVTMVALGASALFYLRVNRQGKM